MLVGIRLESCHFLMVQSWWFSAMPLPRRHRRFQGQISVWQNRENGIISGGKIDERFKKVC